MRILFGLVFIFDVSLGLSQNLDSFRLDFKRALSLDFSSADFDGVMKRHEKLLSYYSYGYHQSDSGQTGSVQFPLRAFRGDSLYYNNIHSLLSSDSIGHRQLAFIVVGAVGDSSMSKSLLERMMMEQNPVLLYYGGMSLYFLGCQATTPIFDLLVKQEHFGDYYFLPAYVRLNKDSLLHTALSRIESNNPKARMLSAYLLGFTIRTRSSEKALRKAVQEWDINLKGYAIVSLKSLKVGNLLSLLKPLLNNPATKSIALDALVASPAARDVRYVKRLARKENPVSIELLTCFYKSTQIEALRYWLQLLRTKTISDKPFWFSVSDQPLLTTDALLPDIRKTLTTAKDPRILRQLSRALQGRTDAKSVQLIIDLLHHPNPEIRYWVAEWNKNCRSSILARVLPALIADPQLRSSPLATLAIENNIDTLQPLFEEMYQDSTSSDFKYAALTYLATFPQPHHREFFRELLKAGSGEGEIGNAQQAALGLGRLKDVASDELIIKSSHIWRGTGGSDMNAYYHLLALEMLKTEKAKTEIQQYLNSKEERMKQFARCSLKDW